MKSFKQYIKESSLMSWEAFEFPVKSKEPNSFVVSGRSGVHFEWLKESLQMFLAQLGFRLEQYKVTSILGGASVTFKDPTTDVGKVIKSIEKAGK